MTISRSSLSEIMKVNQNLPVAYIASQELAKASSLLPSNKQRSMIIHSLAKALGLMNNQCEGGSLGRRRLQIVAPKKASYKDLAVYHSRDYLDTVLDPTTTGETQSVSINDEYGLEDDCPRFAGLPQYIQLVGGATLTAVVALQRGISDISICWDGGRHHARKSQASGFCYVADCILAIMMLKRLNPSPTPAQTLEPPLSPPPPTTRKPRVMYLDLDLHFSDAVSEAFYAPASSVTHPQVLTLSIHHTAPGFFPVSASAGVPSPSSVSGEHPFDPFTLSLPLKQGTSAHTYARIWPIVDRIRNTFRPDFIVLQCGCDALAGDPCKTFNWSLGPLDEPGTMGWCVAQVLKWEGKKLMLGGGGYNSANTARACAYLTSIAINDPLRLDTDIPDHAGFPLYGPSFTLDVPAGTMSDTNTEEYLLELERCYFGGDGAIAALEKRMNGL